MLAIRLEHTGGPESLALRELPLPTPGPGEVLVGVDACGVNYIDVYHRTGLYPIPLPFTPGREGAGHVLALGAGVRGLAEGARVAWCGVMGSYATHLVAPADALVPVPPDVPATTAAAAMLQGLTAHYLATSTFALAPGHTCLVHAAAGGVGLLLCQIAARRGARVIGTASTREKARLARAAGASEVIEYTRQPFLDAVRELTGGAGVDVVYDSVGRTTFDDSLRALRRRGMLVLFGQASGPVPPFDLQTLNRLGSLFVTRPNLADYVATREELLGRSRELFRWIGERALAVRVDRILPLARAADAHRALEARETMGKVLLDPHASSDAADHAIEERLR